MLRFKNLNFNRMKGCWVIVAEKSPGRTRLEPWRVSSVRSVSSKCTFPSMPRRLLYKMLMMEFYCIYPHSGIISTESKRKNTQCLLFYFLGNVDHFFASAPNSFIFWKSNKEREKRCITTAAKGRSANEKRYRAHWMLALK